MLLLEFKYYFENSTQKNKHAVHANCSRSYSSKVLIKNQLQVTQQSEKKNVENVCERVSGRAQRNALEIIELYLDYFG